MTFFLVHLGTDMCCSVMIFFFSFKDLTGQCYIAFGLLLLIDRMASPARGLQDNQTMPDNLF